jgi:hypothetical protein
MLGKPGRGAYGDVSEQHTHPAAKASALRFRLTFGMFMALSKFDGGLVEKGEFGSLRHRGQFFDIFSTRREWFVTSQGKPVGSVGERKQIAVDCGKSRQITVNCGQNFRQREHALQDLYCFS